MTESHDHNPAAVTGRPGALRRRVALSLLFILVVALSLTAWLFYRGLMVPVDPADHALEFEVRPGQTVRRVATALHEHGLIRNAAVFEWYARFTNQTGQIQSGFYAFSPAQSAREILADLVSGAVVDRSLVVTFPEGWTLEQMATRLEALGVVERQRFLNGAVMQSSYRDLRALQDLDDGVDLQGYLFPDTYRFEPDSDPALIVRRMVNRLMQNLPQSWDEVLAAQDRSLHQVLTLASIVQAEALESDVADVAAVFWNRVRSGWRLESDATVNFALGTSKRQPTFADTSVEHPYNTYRFAGLPPGPIGNPGREAIAASFDPPQTPYYFFLHKTDGEIVLSRSFAEHLAAKARWLD